MGGRIAAQARESYSGRLEGLSKETLPKAQAAMTLDLQSASCPELAAPAITATARTCRCPPATAIASNPHSLGPSKQKAAASWEAAAFCLLVSFEPIDFVGLGGLELRYTTKMQVEKVATSTYFSEPGFTGLALARFVGVAEGAFRVILWFTLRRSRVGEADAAKQQQEGKNFHHHGAWLKQVG